MFSENSNSIYFPLKLSLIIRGSHYQQTTYVLSIFLSCLISLPRLQIVYPFLSTRVARVYFMSLPSLPF